jgi:hypothetical protein
MVMKWSTSWRVMIPVEIVDHTGELACGCVRHLHLGVARDIKG